MCPPLPVISPLACAAEALAVGLHTQVRTGIGVAFGAVGSCALGYAAIARDHEARVLTRHHNLQVSRVHTSAVVAHVVNLHAHRDWPVHVGVCDAPSSGDLEELSPDVDKADLQLGDILLLGTDGLTAHVPDAIIRRYLQVQESAQDTCRKLINAANEAGDG
jgi:serine/threonine protein phosphatase PrpC